MPNQFLSFRSVLTSIYRLNYVSPLRIRKPAIDSNYPMPRIRFNPQVESDKDSEQEITKKRWLDDILDGVEEFILVGDTVYPSLVRGCWSLRRSIWFWGDDIDLWEAEGGKLGLERWEGSHCS